MGDEQLEGRADRLLRRLVEAGKTDEAMILIGTLMDDGHDISIAYRAGLIAQGFEVEAMRISQVKIHFHDQGFALQIDPVDGGDWFDDIDPDLKAAMAQALIWIMRGANIDAYIDDDGIISNRGQILPTSPDSVEHLVGQFKAEIDEQFPDVPPTRQGKWW